MNAGTQSTKKRIKSLTTILKSRSGRDNKGHISIRHRGGRQKRFYRLIDFKRDRRDEVATVIGIEYDPNRTADLALVQYADGEKRYIIHPEGLKEGDTVFSGKTDEMKPGNAMRLADIPLGAEIHNVELYPTKGAKIIKSAGSYGIIMAKDDVYADVKLPSKEVRKFSLECFATVGRVSNIEHKLRNYGKAGTRRLMGIRPTVRGLAMSPRSHPHGGGEGRSSEAMNPKTPWGKAARGKKTRSPKWSSKLIVKSRRQK